MWKPLIQPDSARLDSRMRSESVPVCTTSERADCYSWWPPGRLGQKATERASSTGPLTCGVHSSHGTACVWTGDESNGVISPESSGIPTGTIHPSPPRHPTMSDPGQQGRPGKCRLCRLETRCAALATAPSPVSWAPRAHSPLPSLVLAYKHVSCFRLLEEKQAVPRAIMA